MPGDPDSALQPPSSRRWLLAWALVCTLLGVWLSVAGSRAESALMGVVGGGLVALAIAGLGARRHLLRLLDAQPERLGAARPLRALFLISFVVLFVEVMLIRYSSSQVRVFSFYKNVPLVSAFLGLGLGCWLGKGRAGHALWFLVWLVPLAAFLSQGSLVVDETLGAWTAWASAEHVLGDVMVNLGEGEGLWRPQLLMGGVCVVTLVAITGLFTLLGRLLGGAFEGVPRIHAYTANILGSLAGILGFVGVSWLRTPPWVWFVVGLAGLLWWTRERGAALLACAAILACALLTAPGDARGGEVVWSPYQKLVGRSAPSPSRGPAYLVEISDVFYQVALDLRPAAVQSGNPFPHYDAIYEGRPRPERVLIVGAGTGNDVAAALRAGAAHVDAVDIDSAIVDMGRAHHPEQPYADPRVRVLIDDARAAFRKLTPASYDVVVFGLLDSHTQLGMSSVRLDNYVFTHESFLAARRLVKPGGSIAVAAATFRGWFRERLEHLVGMSTDGPVETRIFGGWRTYVGEVRDPNAQPEEPQIASAAGEDYRPELPVDDWPFLYLPRREVPRAYLLVVGLLALASLFVLRFGGLRLEAFDANHAHLLCLGAAFLLMEVYAVNRLALLFGTTWVVSAVTIALVLVLIVAANFTVLAAGTRDLYPIAYPALFACLALSYWADPAGVVGRGLGPSLLYGLVLLSPIYCAGLVFACSFRASEQAGAAIGANILGSVVGGWIEYTTMAVGIRAMVLLAALFYLGSLLALRRAQRRAGEELSAGEEPEPVP